MICLLSHILKSKSLQSIELQLKTEIAENSNAATNFIKKAVTGNNGVLSNAQGFRFRPRKSMICFSGVKKLRMRLKNKFEIHDLVFREVVCSEYL